MMWEDWGPPRYGRLSFRVTKPANCRTFGEAALCLPPPAGTYSLTHQEVGSLPLWWNLGGTLTAQCGKVTFWDF